MLKVKDFDYDLWTTVEDGVKHYWANVRETGEITEISHEVMVYLRSEEKRMEKWYLKSLRTCSPYQRILV